MISAIVATAKNNAIGRDGDLPWDYPEDMKFFKKMTMGRTLIMGRKTYESIGGPLKGRKIIVLSHSLNSHDVDSGVYACSTPGDAITNALHLDDDPVVCGGAAIYDLFMPFVDRIWMTKIDVDIPDADTFFPQLNMSDWLQAEYEAGLNSKISFNTFKRVTTRGLL